MLNYLLGTAFSAEALSRPARSACFLPICSFGWRSLWANECGLEKRSSTCRALFSAEALSRPARPASSSFLLPAHSFGWCSLWANECGPARSASFLPFCCRRTPLVSFLFPAAGALLWFVLAAAKRVRQASKQASKPEPAKSRCQNKKNLGWPPVEGRRHPLNPATGRDRAAGQSPGGLTFRYKAARPMPPTMRRTCADHAPTMRRPCAYVLYWAHPYKGRRIRGLA